jgi:hypothetical protein
MTVHDLNINSININTWYHFAVVKNESIHTVYINGTSRGTFSLTTTTPSNTIIIGDINNTFSTHPAYVYTFDGYITNFRYVLGTEVYTSNFTPSTSTLTAIPGTELLLLTNYGPSFLLDSSPNPKTLLNYNNTAVSSSVSVFPRYDGFKNVGKILGPIGPTGPASQWQSGSGYIYYNGNAVVNKTTANINSSALDVSGNLNVSADLYSQSGALYSKSPIYSISTATSSSANMIINYTSGSCFSLPSYASDYTLVIVNYPTTIVPSWTKLTIYQPNNTDRVMIGVTINTYTATFKPLNNTGTASKSVVYDIHIYTANSTTFVVHAERKTFG